MPRPRKFRRVCCLPQSSSFGPYDRKETGDMIVMTVDEYETIRLIDYEGLTQEECSINMNIARTTVTQIYLSARQKLSQVLVEGKPLTITGGDYTLCDGETTVCKCPRCRHKNMINNVVFNDKNETEN